MDFIPGNTRIKTDKRGFAHVLAFDGNRIWPCVYNNRFGTFVCKDLILARIKQFAYMPEILEEVKD